MTPPEPGGHAPALGDLPPGDAYPGPVALVGRLKADGATVATAESLTGGLVVARLIDVPGASAVVRGGIVAYQGDVKASLVGVDANLLQIGGAVQADVAAQLAVGARERLGATWGIGTTGVAGPDPADGQAVGTAFVAVASASGVLVRRLALSGDRRTVREACVVAALALLWDQLTSCGTN